MTKTQFTPLQSGLCPLNSTEWETMKKKWNCPDPEFYHCIPNQYNVPGEICVKANWASKNYCPIFNTAANDIDLIPCDLQYGACSDTDYRSNKVYLYPGCLNKTSIIEITSTLPEESQSDFPPEIIIPIVLCIVLLLGFVLICVLWRRKRIGTNTSRKGREMIPLLDESEIPFEFHRIIKHLEAGVFITTDIYQDAVGILETRGWVTLIGPPGSGKTMTAIALARKLTEKRSSKKIATVHFCQSLSDVSALQTDREKPYVILDGFLEQYRYYPSKLLKDKDMFDNIFHEFIKTELVCVIFTVRKNTWVKFPIEELHPELFNEYALVHLMQKALTVREKDAMLRTHLEIGHIELKVEMSNEKLNPSQEVPTVEMMNENLNPSCENPTVEMMEENLTPSQENPKVEMMKENFIPSQENLNVELAKENEIPSQKMNYDTAFICGITFNEIAFGLKADSAFSVPVIIDLMCVNRYFLKNHSHIISDSFKVSLKLHVKKWMKSKNDDDQKSKCIVLFAALCGGRVSIDDFCSHTKGQTYTNVCEKFGVQRIMQEEIKTMMKENVRVRGFLYHVENSDMYMFYHDSLLDSFLVFACSDEKFFIENVNIDYLIQRCKLSTQLTKKIFEAAAGKINVNPENVFELKEHDLLAKRIHAEMLCGHSLPDWENHIFMTNGTFKSRWNATLSMSKYGTSETKRGDSLVEDIDEKQQIKLSTHPSVRGETLGEQVVNFLMHANDDQVS